MYAIFANSGSQHFVEEGKRIEVDLLDVEAGSTVEFDQVLVIGGGDSATKIGKPYIAGAKVVAEVVGEISGPKLHVQTYQRRKNFKRHRGHRQHYTQVTIKQIVVGG